MACKVLSGSNAIAGVEVGTVGPLKESYGRFSAYAAKKRSGENQADKAGKILSTFCDALAVANSSDQRTDLLSRDDMSLLTKAVNTTVSNQTNPWDLAATTKVSRDVKHTFDKLENFERKAKRQEVLEIIEPYLSKFL